MTPKDFETTPQLRDYYTRKINEYGSKFDPSDLDPRFAQFYATGKRIRVNLYGQTKTGTIGVTTGWKPAFLLMRRRTDHGSSNLLSSSTEFVGQVK